MRYGGVDRDNSVKKNGDYFHGRYEEWIVVSLRKLPSRSGRSRYCDVVAEKEDVKTQREMICLDQNPIEGGDCGVGNERPLLALTKGRDAVRLFISQLDAPKSRILSNKIEEKSC